MLFGSASLFACNWYIYRHLDVNEWEYSEWLKIQVQPKLCMLVSCMTMYHVGHNRVMWWVSHTLYIHQHYLPQPMYWTRPVRESDLGFPMISTLGPKLSQRDIHIAVLTSHDHMRYNVKCMKQSIWVVLPQNNHHTLSNSRHVRFYVSLSHSFSYMVNDLS